MTVAVRIQPSAAAQRKARRSVPFGIELHKLQPLVRNKGKKRDVMFACHRVTDGDVKLVLHRIEGDLMRRIWLLGLERRERHTTATARGQIYAERAVKSGDEEAVEESGDNDRDDCQRREARNKHNGEDLIQQHLIIMDTLAAGGDLQAVEQQVKA